MSDPAIERLKTRIAELIEVLIASGEKRETPLLFEKALSDAIIVYDNEIIQLCFNRGLYEICRIVNQEDTKIAKRERTRAQRLEELNVPHDQRTIILQLGIDNVRCPLRGNVYVDLYGPEQASPEEIRSAAAAYDPQIRALRRARTLLLRLAAIVERRNM